jgi:hypothetical protein
MADVSHNLFTVFSQVTRHTSSIIKNKPKMMCAPKLACLLEDEL